jgi:hypothetical protein
LSLRFGRCATAFAAVAASLAFASTASAAGPSAGDPTLDLKVGDDVAGGTTDVTFERAYSGTTANGTPVFVYVPQGALDPNTGTTVTGNDPTFDPKPNDEYKPCADNTRDQYKITQTQVTTLGDELKNRIVQVDTAHYGQIGDANKDGQTPDPLVVLAYDIIDGAYYDCAATQYTAGYFAPGFIDDYGMNVIVVDSSNWTEMVGNPNTTDLTYEGVIAHELQHLLHNYSDPGELSWVDEGLADFAIFLNGFPTGGSHATYHQVFHRETSLTRWGGGLENYGASFSFFQYVWEQAGGNGGTGAQQYKPDLAYNDRAGDLLIKRIFENKADGMEGVQAAIDEFNSETKGNLRSARELFKDWAVAVYLDREGWDRFDIRGFDFGDPATTSWTIDLANNEYWGGRDVYQGAVPQAKYENRRKRGLTGDTVALPYSTSYQTYRNPGPTFAASLMGAPATTIAPHEGPEHWYAGYQSQSDTLLNVTSPVSGGQAFDFWSWHFIEEGWDYGFVEAKVGDTWQTIPLKDDDGNVVTTNENPQGNNTEGNGLTGTSGGEYFVDDPQYQHLNGTLPEGATQLRFRYSTDTAYLDTGWFVDEVKVGGTAAQVEPEGKGWFSTTGRQDNHWVLQVIAPCDLTPGRTTTGEISDSLGNHVYRFEGSDISQGGFQSKCAGKTGITTVISNMPTGDLSFLDADYTFALRK